MHKWFLYELDGAAMRPLPGLEEGEEPIRFTSNGKALFTYRTNKPEMFIYRVELTGWTEFDRDAVPS